jgi:molecular chaperone IbpA
MREFDLTPLFRSSVGFDRLDKLFEAAFRDAGRDNSYPPYNIVKTGPESYRITMAVAGFGEEDLDLQVENNVLTVRGQIREQPKDIEYLHRGIAQRAFEHRFQLADHVRIVDAGLEKGLLSIRLERVIPEAMRPRKIKLTSETGGTTSPAIAGKVSAA